MDNQHRMITGYRELSQEEIDLMNIIKEAGPTLRHLVETVEAGNHDSRWSDLARTHFQQGLMALTRAVAQPDFF